jgi:hypothetical protein
MRSPILFVSLFLLALGSGACGGSSSPPGPTSGTMSLTPSDDTFMNGRTPDNNNGGSASVFVGVDGQDGSMRGLVRFEMPPALHGATVTGVQLTMTSRALGQGGVGPDVMLSLQAVTEAWVQGDGVGDAAMLNTVGQMCSDTVSGATWNDPDCVGGAGTPWMTAGGTVAATVSGVADTTGVAVDMPVVWDGAVAGNAGMIADVQSWIDNPGGNHGWRITSSDELTSAAAKRFYSFEAGGTTVPTLAVAYMHP